MIMSPSDIEIGRIGASTRKRMSGFSLIELVIALGVVSILTAISIPYLYQYRKLYKSEDQAIKIMDLMREAGQIALTKRRTIRLDINISNPANPVVHLTDEAGAATDVLAKTIPLEPFNEIRMDVAPAGVTKPNPPNYADVAFTAGVWSMRFKSDGSVRNAADIPISGTLYVWPPKTVPYNSADLTPRLTEVRAITIFGGSGAVRYWKHNGTAFVPFQ